MSTCEAAEIRPPPLTASNPALLADGSDHRFRQLVHDLLTVTAQMKEIRDRLADEMGLSGPQYSILLAAAHLADGAGVGVGEMARHLHVSGAFVTTETGKLAEKGLLGKANDADDRRRVLVSLTDEGRRAVRAIAPLQRAVNDQFFAGLGQTEFRILSQIVGRMVGSSEAALSLLRYKSRAAAD